MEKMKAKRVHEFIREYVVKSGEDFRLKDHDPADTRDLKSEDKPEAKRITEEGIVLLSEMQDKLYAQSNWGLLLIFQAMDAAGKDSTIKHVMSGVNPQGVKVQAFKEPSSQELAHDFMWRTNRCLPARGKIGIFNRSHYEEVLVVRVHPEILEKQRLPPSLVGGKKFWDHRLEAIADFERYLARQGTVVLKFFLNLSKEEQKRRFLSRLDEPDKNWKFSSADLAERAYWDDYQTAYQEAIAATAASHAPWFVVPADNK